MAWRWLVCRARFVCLACWVPDANLWVGIERANSGGEAFEARLAESSQYQFWITDKAKGFGNIRIHSCFIV